MSREKDTERLKRFDDDCFNKSASTHHGINVIAWLIDVCGVNRQSFDGYGDAKLTAFLEGKRSIGLMLLSRMHEDGMIEADYYKVVQERDNLRRKDARDARLKGDNVNAGWLGSDWDESGDGEF